MNETYIYDPHGNIVFPGASHVKQYPWENAGSITVAEGALASDKRDETSVAALAATKTIIWTPDDGVVAAAIRVRTIGAENDVNVIEMYAAAAEPSGAIRHYSRVATLTCLQGTQIHSATIYFNDSIVVTNNCWLSTPVVVQPTVADNHISQYVLNLHGHDRFLFIVSTLDSSTSKVYVDVRRI